MSNTKARARDEHFIYRPWITKNGVRIYPKNARVFKIPVDIDHKEQ